MSEIDRLVWSAHFATEAEQKSALATLLQLARERGCAPTSIYPIYKARAEGLLPATFTVPAMNLRGLSYLTAQAAFLAAQKLQVGLMIFELARSEMKYTAQSPLQLASSVIGAALTTNWQGPIFIQGDHYQPAAEAPGVIKTGEKEALQKLIKDSIDAGIYNIDIDGSKLINDQARFSADQQQPNAEFTVEMISYIRSLQPVGAPISIGCEIAEVGSHLSTPMQLRAFMQSLQKSLPRSVTGPSKVAIETGTKHGGNVNPDGTQGTMTVEFAILKRMSQLARQRYGLAGAVQHGASTLTKDVFAQFPLHETVEIHLSTGFQNLIMDHPAFPAVLRQQMYAWCDEHCAKERKPEWTDAQFYAKTRKKTWGALKEQTWKIGEENQQAIKNSLQQECELYFGALRVTNTQALLHNFY